MNTYLFWSNDCWRPGPIFSIFSECWCLQPLLCYEYNTLRRHKCMYCMTNSGSVFLAFYPPLAIIFIFDSCSLVFCHLCIRHCAVAKLGFCLMSGENVVDGTVECPFPAWNVSVLWPFQTFTQMLSSKKMAADSQVKSTECTWESALELSCNLVMGY